MFDGAVAGGSKGWQQELSPEGRWRAFAQRALPLETPDYFETAEPIAEMMTVAQLKRYIDELAASGFNVVPLTVDLQQKLAFPFVTLVMTLLAVPFGMTTGKRGTLYGIGIGIVLALSLLGPGERVRRGRQGRTPQSDTRRLGPKHDRRGRRRIPAPDRAYLTGQTPVVGLHTDRRSDPGCSVTHRRGVGEPPGVPIATYASSSSAFFRSLASSPWRERLAQRALGDLPCEHLGPLPRRPGRGCDKRAQPSRISMVPSWTRVAVGVLDRIRVQLQFGRKLPRRRQRLPRLQDTHCDLPLNLVSNPTVHRPRVVTPEVNEHSPDSTLAI